MLGDSMARRSRRDDADTNDIASDPISSLLSPTAMPSPIIRDAFEDLQVLSEIEDLRSFNPDPYRIPSAFTGLPAPITERRSTPLGRPVYPAFAQSQHAVVCARRKTRREVMFAKKSYRRRGRGGGRRKLWSEFKC